MSVKLESFVMVLILISSVCLCLQNPLEDPKSDLMFYLDHIDFVVTICFTLEMSIKVTALGFIACGPQSYMRNIENLLDFAIVSTSLLSLILTSNGQEARLGMFRAMRLARLFRPLRLIGKNEGLKTSIKALIVAIPAILN